MREDIDRFMAEKRLDALLIIGPTTRNPAMAYFAGQTVLSQGEILKKRGEPPILFHVPMERDGAARSGLLARQLDGTLSRAQFRAESGGDEVEARALRYRQMLAEYLVTGRVALYGKVELGSSWSVLQRVQEMVPDIEFVGEGENASVLARARMTKDKEEIQRIRRVGEATVAVVAEVADFLTSHRARKGVLVNRDGQPLTIGAVKRQITMWLAERALEAPKGFIFAIGRDAGVPHSVGNNADPVVLGKPLVFDIYPTEAGGGYFFDFTRTWCLGHAPDRLWQVYEDVRDAFTDVCGALQVNTRCRTYQIMVCEHFSTRGHRTVMDEPDLAEGYVHGLGHGLGLSLPEPPSMVHLESNNDMLLPGSVVTVEPGLYYPGQGIGVRLEDTVWVKPDGGVEPLATFPTDLVLPLASRGTS